MLKDPESDRNIDELTMIKSTPRFAILSRTRKAKIIRTTIPPQPRSMTITVS